MHQQHATPAKTAARTKTASSTPAHRATHITMRGVAANSVAAPAQRTKLLPKEEWCCDRATD